MKERQNKDWLLVASAPEWSLFFHAGRFDRGSDWLNFKLVFEASEKLRKRRYWVGWNYKKRRFSRNYEIVILAERHPEVLVKVQRAVKAVGERRSRRQEKERPKSIARHSHKSGRNPLGIAAQPRAPIGAKVVRLRRDLGRDG